MDYDEAEALILHFVIRHSLFGVRHSFHLASFLFHILLILSILSFLQRRQLKTQLTE